MIGLSVILILSFVVSFIYAVFIVPERPFDPVRERIDFMNSRQDNR